MNHLHRLAILLCIGSAPILCIILATPRAAAGTCSFTDPNCVEVGAENPGSSGTPGSNGSDGSNDASGSSGDSTPPPPSCWWIADSDQPADPQDPRLEGHEPGTVVFEWQVCSGSSMNGLDPTDSYVTGVTRVVPGASPTVPSPAVLAEQAAASFRLPDPTWGRFPAFTLKDGRPYTVVKTHMWFWTDPATWQTLSATARAGANWATVTATPEALVLVPGDGNGAVECASSGRAFDKTRDAYRSSWVPQPEPDGCDYVYQRSTWDYPGEVLTASLQIRWVLSWTGSGNTSGTLTSRVTSADSTFMVAELQAVVTG